jgi:septum formation protein
MILLGSGSPRRKQLIEALGFKYRVMISHTDEIPPEELKREQIAIFLAEEKATALSGSRKTEETLITADTIVCLGDMVLNKPGDEMHALEMLMHLNGVTHQVYTGVCIVGSNGIKSFSVCSDVTFNRMADAELKDYIQKYKPFDKAGSYGAQECLPEGMNPCSPAELAFLIEHNLHSLFEDTLVSAGHNVIPLINRIEGSYFNVMGLPVVELWEALQD